MPTHPPTSAGPQHPAHKTLICYTDADQHKFTTSMHDQPTEREDGGSPRLQHAGEWCAQFPSTIPVTARGVDGAKERKTKQHKSGPHPGSAQETWIRFIHMWVGSALQLLNWQFAFWRCWWTRAIDAFLWLVNNVSIWSFNFDPVLNVCTHVKTDHDKTPPQIFGTEEIWTETDKQQTSKTLTWLWKRQGCQQDDNLTQDHSRHVRRALDGVFDTSAEASAFCMLRCHSAFVTCDVAMGGAINWLPVFSVFQLHQSSSSTLPLSFMGSAAAWSIYFFIFTK